MNDDRTTPPQPAPQEPSRADSPLANFPAEPQTAFSLRFLIGVGACCAAMFAIVGVVGRDWPTRHLMVFLVLFLGWNGLCAALVYLGLLYRRRTARRFGRLLYRSRRNAMFPQVKSRTGLYVLAAVCFFIWEFATIYYAHELGGEDDAFALAKYVGIIPFHFLIIFVFQVSALYQAVAGPSALEVYERGLFSRGFGAAPWELIRSLRWSGSVADTLLAVVSIPGGGGNTGAIEVPGEDRERVATLLRAALRERFLETLSPEDG